MKWNIKTGTTIMNFLEANDEKKIANLEETFSLRLPLLVPQSILWKQKITLFIIINNYDNNQ